MVRPGVCCEFGSKIQDLDPGCRILSKPDYGGCEHKRGLVTLSTPPIGAYLMTAFVHEDCLPNQHIAVVNRVLGVTPPCQPQMLPLLKYASSIIARHLPHNLEQEIGEFAYAYSGAKRARYLQAAEKLIQFGISKKDAGISMFVKADRLNPLEKIRPDPRAIQFRDPVYCVDLARYLKPIEHSLYALKLPEVGPYRLIGKGLNQYERASLLIQKTERFGEFVVITIDASRFDKHVNLPLLRAEHRVYKICNRDPHLAELLRWQEVNQGRSKLGLKYVTRGKRMSGDMNTALGNCIIMIMMVLGAFKDSGLEFDILDDGDDCLIIGRRSDEAKLKACIATINNFGMVIKTENVAYSIEEVEWCQSRPVFTAKGWKFCRNPWKVMSYSLSGCKWKHLNYKGRQTYLRGLAECECILNKGVPVLTAFAESLLRNAGCGKTTFDQSSGEYFRYIRELRQVKSVSEWVPVTLEARLSFERAWGCPPHIQIKLEDQLKNWSFNLRGLETDEPVVDNEFWLDHRNLFPPPGDIHIHTS